jgi:hypothetical protein
LKTAINLGDGTVALTWAPAADAAAYAVWTSTDGLVWDRAQAVVETGTSHVLSDSPEGVPVYVRVAAFDNKGAGEPSDVYAATPSSAGSSVLVVDGNDRWDTQWENTRGAGQDFVRSVAEAMPGVSVDSAAHEAVVDGTVDLARYEAVIWLLGEESTEDQALDPDERDLLADYLDGGGALLVSGAELGWDLDALGDGDMQSFYHDYLHATFIGDDADTFSALPVAGGLFDGVGELGFYTPQRMEIDYPDQIAPFGGATAELSYVGGYGGTAAIAYDGPSKVVNLGFPIESIDGKDTRTAVLDRILALFGVSD